MQHVTQMDEALNSQAVLNPKNGLGEFDIVGLTFFIACNMMLAFTAFFFVQVGVVPQKWKTSVSVAGCVTGVAWFNYLFMRQNWEETGASPTNFRYTDWLITVPLQIVEFYFILSANGAIPASLGQRLLGSSLAMVFFGFLSEIDVMQKIVGFVLAMACWFLALSFLGVVSGIASDSPPPARSPADPRPNIVFLVVESTDGRAWSRNYQNGAVDLPNIRSLQDQGVEFQSHYSNAPVCCPSRATFWSGRHAHNIPHDQKSSGMFVGGAWNNYEGLPPNFSKRMDQVMGNEGYNVKVSGKEDWTAGGHSENVFLNAWTMYTRFPYDLSKGTGGWTDENGCVDPGHVKPGGSSGAQGSVHGGDWEALKSTVAWIRSDAAKDKKPFFVYQGMTIVHPPYRTSEYWYNKVDQSKIEVPEWKDLSAMHPCDFQSSMLKGCLPPEGSSGDFYTTKHRVHIRTIYLAMVAEFDAMVGEYIKAVKDSGKFDNTVFIVTSDHGDMQMEHRQFYKMVPYDASARVPMVIMDARNPRKQSLLTNATTQLIDIYPTVLTYAGVPKPRWPTLDGFPMQSVMVDANQDVPKGRVWSTVADRPDYVVSQFHGDNIAMSWFLVVQDSFKLVVWGTGKQHPNLLFDLVNDVNETTNLVDKPEQAQRVQSMLGKLQGVVDFPTIAQNVAKYGHDSMKWWTQHTKNWEGEMGKKGLRWHESWSQNSKGAVAAVEDFLKKPPQVESCRSDRVWPPKATETIV